MQRSSITTACLFLTLLAASLGYNACTRLSGGEFDITAEQMQTLYSADIARFDSSAAVLEQLGKSFLSKNASLEEVQTAFRRCRLAYKRCETFAEYFSSGGSAREINGAARDEVEENDPNQIVRSAEGLQVIETLLFPAFDNSDSTTLRVLLNQLGFAVKKLSTLAETIHFTPTSVFEAVRYELVRVASLGVSGFDAMVVQSSIPESAEALDVVKSILAVYRHQAPNEFESTAEQIESARQYLLANRDFASFDRTEFLRVHLNIIIRAISTYQQAAGIPHSTAFRALNAKAGSMFQNDAFTAAYFAPTLRSSDPRQTTLGKILFFDPALSRNNRRACASCHDPAKGFTDGATKSLSMDFAGTVSRNSPTLLNAALQRAYFYDSRVLYLEDQVTAVASNHQEFDCPPEVIVKKLSESDEYRKLFAEAFADGNISVNNFRTALAEFIRSLTAMNSPFDKYMRGESNVLPPDVKRGFNLFAGKAKCATCHFIPLFNGTVPPLYDKSEFEILGVLKVPDTVRGTIDSDLGRMAIDRIEMNRFGFKTPTVRNAALTAPYMHNGAYKTLEDVLHFYNHGGAAGLGHRLDNQTLPPDKLRLNKQEMQDIIAFLHSLTDTSSIISSPSRLPVFSAHPLASRVIGGEY